MKETPCKRLPAHMASEQVLGALTDGRDGDIPTSGTCWEVAAGGGG